MIAHRMFLVACTLTLAALPTALAAQEYTTDNAESMRGVPGVFVAIGFLDELGVSRSAQVGGSQGDGGDEA
jgi:hypothetical protein